jgi:hypothetical protein
VGGILLAPILDQHLFRTCPDVAVC